MELLPLALLFFLLLLTSSSYSKWTPNNNSTDLSSLLSFKSHVADPSGILASKWTTNTSFCNWFGVSCSRRRQRVTSIDLQDVPLQGTISPHLANLSFLSFLNVSNCSLFGHIPDQLAYLHRISILYLRFNSLSGHIPSAIFNISSLKVFSVKDNNITGSIPVVTLPRLQFISLSLNQLTGAIPSSFANCTQLHILSLSGNLLSGTLPTEFGNLPVLAYLFLGGNQLTGTIPTSIGNPSNLVYLDLSWNMLEGFHPRSVGNFSKKLQYFRAGRNPIMGNIPEEFGNLSSLLLLDLEQDELTGGIPPSLTRSRSLQSIILNNNQLSGFIPIDIGVMTSLFGLELDNNALSGPIPSSLGNISSLVRLSLAANRLVSNIPNSLWSSRGLIDLVLFDNNLDGPLPLQIDNKNLEYLDFSKNLLSNSIPSALGELVMLTFLDLSNNSFHGQIPQTFGMLINGYVNLSHNFISGTIPKSLSNLRYLSILDLSFNLLEGPIPDGGVFSNLSIPSLMRNKALCGAPKLRFSPCSLDGNMFRSKRNVRILKYALSAIASTAILFVSFYLLLNLYRRKSMPPIEDASLVDYRRISYHGLVNATENFSDANIVGRGSVGTVFKACLNDGLPVAVKVLNLDVQRASRSFAAECEALRMVRHRNLVRIISICYNDDFKALILQFMPNGSLEKWLYSENCYLNILQRINIAIDVSLALEYLHHHHPYIVVHRDLKPSNVLMDEEMVAHVGDFGIAKLLHDESKSAMSASTPGTIGYMAPEYGLTGKVSRKTDVYSFGILLLEICTQKRPTDTMFDGELNMREWVSKAYPDEVLEIIDCNLIREESNNNQETTLPIIIHQCFSSMIELGLLCSRESPKERLQMKDVVPKLQKIKMNYISMLPS